jgi:gamma-tubulin complex component 5
MTFEKWCAEKEEIICRAKGGDSPQQIVASLLSLDKDVKAIVDCTFEVLLEVIKEVRLVAKQALNRHDDTEALDFSSLHPSILSTTVLDSLASAIQTVLSTNPSISSATALGSVFSSTAAPLWSSLLRWLKDGASMLDQEESFTEEDSEFFIRRRVEVSVSSPEFWVWGYSVRTRSVEEDDTEGSGVVPAFLGGVVKDIMAAGKAVGLLRALGVEDFFRDEDGVRWLEDYWIGIENLVHNGGAATNESHVQPSEDAAQPPHSKFDVPPTYSLLSTENFDLLTTDYLAPICRSAQLRLNRIFTEDLRMWDHLQCIEDLYLMRKGDVCGHFCDILFGKVRRFGGESLIPVLTRQRWYRWTNGRRGMTSTFSIRRFETWLTQVRVHGSTRLWFSCRSVGLEINQLLGVLESFRLWLSSIK